MYQLDTQEARKADSTGGMISEIGKYIGTFTQAVDVTARTGTKGVALNFQSNAGQKARLSIYTMKTDGEKLMGYQALMAIMTCLKLRQIVDKEGVAMKWDNDSKSEVSVQAVIFPELCNKPIGVLLETEDYIKNDGGTGTRMVLRGIFQAETELTATEILDKKTKPEQLEKMVISLRHRPVKGAKPMPARQHAPAAAAGADFDDGDIPF
jgi:biotin-(acetyl-CoA carboxylase) ligase